MLRAFRGRKRSRGLVQQIEKQTGSRAGGGDSLSVKGQIFRKLVVRFCHPGGILIAGINLNDGGPQLIRKLQCRLRHGQHISAADLSPHELPTVPTGQRAFVDTRAMRFGHPRGPMRERLSGRLRKQNELLSPPLLPGTDAHPFHIRRHAHRHRAVARMRKRRIHIRDGLSHRPEQKTRAISPIKTTILVHPYRLADVAQ